MGFSTLLFNMNSFLFSYRRCNNLSRKTRTPGNVVLPIPHPNYWKRLINICTKLDPLLARFIFWRCHNNLAHNDSNERVPTIFRTCPNLPSAHAVPCIVVYKLIITIVWHIFITVCRGVDQGCQSQKPKEPLDGRMIKTVSLSSAMTTLLDDDHLRIKIIFIRANAKW